MRPRGRWRADLLFALALLALAAGVWLWQRAHTAPGRTALVQYGQAQTATLDLTQDGDYDLESNGYTVHLEVRDGAIRFVDSPCPDHRCEGFGWLRDAGAWAACLPAQVMVTVQEEG